MNLHSLHIKNPCGLVPLEKILVILVSNLLKKKSVGLKNVVKQAEISLLFCIQGGP